MTSKELLKNAQLTFTGDKLLQLLEIKEEKEKEVNSNEIVDAETKTPSLLPQPFRSGGWIATYIALNGVLLTLYLVLGIPYFATGRTVEEVAEEEEFNFDPPEVENEAENEGEGEAGGEGEGEAGGEGGVEEAANRQDAWRDEYLGYTTYGKNDVSS